MCRFFLILETSLFASLRVSSSPGGTLDDSTFISWPSPVQGFSHKESEEILDNLSDLLRTSELGELQDFRIAGFRLGLDVSSHLKEMLGV